MTLTERKPQMDLLRLVRKVLSGGNVSRVRALLPPCQFSFYVPPDKSSGFPTKTAAFWLRREKLNSALDVLGEVKWDQRILFHIEFATLSVDSSLVILHKFTLLREKIRENFCAPRSRNHRLTMQQR